MGAQFKITFPKGAGRYILLADGDITVDYGPKQWVNVQVITAEGMRFPRSDRQKKARPDALATADIPRILYSKTVDDVEPAHTEDRRI